MRIFRDTSTNIAYNPDAKCCKKRTDLYGKIQGKNESLKMSKNSSINTIDLKDITGTFIRPIGIISFEKSPERRFYYEKDLEKKVELEKTRE